MYKTTSKTWLLLLLVLLLMAGCNKQSTGTVHDLILSHRECNSVYYWKTSYRLIQEEIDFLQRYQVGRMYIRFFDVVMDTNPMTLEWDAIPNATIQFLDRPDSTLEIVPTVYITLEALKLMKDAEEEYAGKIVERVMAMVKANKLNNVKEIQLDCDWTGSTEYSYFRLCREVWEQLHSQSVAVSATIRLHQLRQNEPPVDRVVLMLYNTGNIRSAKTENSILSYDDVLPYLNKKITYGLHLDYAYPTFYWGVWFHDGQFRAILDRKTLTEMERSEQIRKKDGRYYEVVESGFGKGDDHPYYQEGDRIRIEKPSFREIMRVKNLVERRLETKSRSNILYHLDLSNLSNYSGHEIETMFCTD
ncbi:hypothetical protein [uncultured Parabacteroides sp.]|uniref:hypothetical protein n=1 Tax=uncultured Parabacteroides sp. TaxID=512312 RepID=UPI002595A2F8|nr:hypothetical protein [uncultured Parabacteroides sp.]